MQQNTSDSYTQLFENGQILFGLAGTLLYHEPTNAAVDSLISGRDTLSDPALSALLPKGAAALQAALEELAQDTTQELRSLLLQEYTALFIQRTTSKLYPWESVYTTHDHTLFGESTLEVQALYRSFDITLGETPHEPQDHLGLELLFLSLLSERGLTALEQDDLEEAARLFSVQKEFLDKHVFVFAGDFIEEFAKKAQTDYYQATCLFVSDTLAWAKKAYSV